MHTKINSYYFMKSPANFKKQRIISSFFTPAGPKKVPEPSSSSLEVSNKRKLESFLHSKEPTTSPKKARVESQLKTVGSTETDAKAPRRSIKDRSNPLAARTKTKLTPLEKQYIELKLQHQDKILAIQVGYKFKFFGHDAVVASQLLNIMLIPGNLGLDERQHDRFAYCSIPDNRLHIHLQRLLNHGLKVGVVKQTETAAIKSVESSNKSGLFERKVTGVYTRSTYMGDELLTGDPTLNRSANVEFSEESTFILCINELQHPKNSSVVAVDPVTGDIVFDEFPDTATRDELDTRLQYLKPSEVIVIGNDDNISSETKKVLQLNNPNVAISFEKQKKESQIHTGLSDFFVDVDEEGRSAHLAEHYMLNYSFSIQSCIHELIHYLAEFKLSNVFTIPTNFTSLTDSRKCMLLPGNTLKALDIFEVQDDPSSRKGTLMWLLDHAYTRKGSRLLKKWIHRPLVKKEDIEDRLEAVEALKLGEFSHLVDSLRGAIVKIGKSGVDLDKLLIKIHYSATYLSGKISRKDVYMMLKNFLDILDISKRFGEEGVEEFEKSNQSTMISNILRKLYDLSQEPVATNLLEMIDASAALNTTNLNEQRIHFFNLRNGKFDSVAAEIEQIAIIESQLDQELENIRKFLKRPQLSFITNLNDTHLIEVRNGKAVDALPSDWVKISGTKTVSRFRTPAISSLHKQLQYHNDMVLKAADLCFNEYLKEIDSHYEYFHHIVSNIATFDCLLSLARASAASSSQNYARPTLVDDQVIDIKQATNPILSSLSLEYVPNDIDISYDDNRVLIITGPNMGGKSTYVKQIALLVILAQIGCLLPCASARMGIFDSIFIRMGAHDNILRGKSTFMVEMLESSNIIQNYTDKSLIILDEIGRGTGTSDGISLAYSILRYIIEDPKKPLALFITHYPSLHVLDKFDGVKNYHMAFVEKTLAEGKENDWPEVIFLYKLVQGVVSNLYGLNVAKLAGIDQKIIENAYKVSEAMKNLVERKTILDSVQNLTRANAGQILADICANL